MEGIITNPFSGQEYIQYGKLIFKNETGKIYRVDPATVDMDQFVQVDTSLTGQTLVWKNYFGDIALSQSPVADIKAEDIRNRRPAELCGGRAVCYRRNERPAQLEIL